VDVGIGGFGFPGHFNPAFTGMQGGKAQNGNAYIKSVNGPDMKRRRI